MHGVSGEVGHTCTRHALQGLVYFVEHVRHAPQIITGNSPEIRSCTTFAARRRRYHGDGACHAQLLPLSAVARFVSINRRWK